MNNDHGSIGYSLHVVGLLPRNATQIVLTRPEMGPVTDSTPPPPRHQAGWSG